LLRPLAKNILVLRIGLREVVVTKALAVLHVAGALAVSLDDQFDAPFNLIGRTFTASAKELIVFDLQLADVAFKLAEFFVDGGDGGSLSRFLW
jgi:hypothetical protein